MRAGTSHNAAPHGRRLIPAEHLAMDDVIAGRGGDAVVAAIWASRTEVRVVLADLHTGERRVRRLEPRRPVRVLAHG